MKISQAEKLQASLETMLNSKGIVGYKIARNCRMIREELQEYYEAKRDLLRKYGEEKDGVLMINTKSDSFPLYAKEIAPLEDQDISFDFRLFSEEEIENSDLNGAQMLFIMENFMKGEDDGSND